MATKLTLSHPGGSTATAYKGWSWTCFFWGFLPPLFRGDVKNFILFFIVHLILGIGVLFHFGILNGIFALVIAAKYNEWHLNGLIEKGYTVPNVGLGASNAPLSDMPVAGSAAPATPSNSADDPPGSIAQ